jgi:hypothetical protein
VTHGEFLGEWREQTRGKQYVATLERDLLAAVVAPTRHPPIRKRPVGSRWRRLARSGSVAEHHPQKQFASDKITVCQVEPERVPATAHLQRRSSVLIGAVFRSVVGVTGCAQAIRERHSFPTVLAR